MQVVEKNNQRIVRAGEDAHEIAENHIEAVLSFSRRQTRDRRLRTDYEFDIGNYIDDDLAVLSQDGIQTLLPESDAITAFGQKLAHQSGKGLNEGAIGDIALVLFEFTGREIAPLIDNGFVNFVDQGGLARTRTPGDEYSGRLSLRDAIEGFQQFGHFAFAPVELLRNLEAIANIVPPRDKVCQISALEALEAFIQVRLQATGTLIAFLSGFIQEFEHQGRDGGRHL